MSNSSLISYTQLSPNCSARTSEIKKITIHHAACVNCSLAALGAVFAPKSRQASSNYGIDSEGNIGMFVEEKNRAWTSSNFNNDNQAVTIEVVNSTGAPDWKVSDKAYAALINLCVDICKRNNIKEINFTGDKNGNLTMHKWFASTACPGPYLEKKFSDIAAKVNEQLGVTENVKPTLQPTAPSTPSPARPILSIGSRGSAVKKLQKDLIELGYNLGSYGADGDGADGEFGTLTRTAVVELQNKYDLDPDGVVGPLTYQAIDKALEDKKNEVNSQQELPFLVKVSASLLNIRRGPGTDYPIAGQIENGGIYTIVEVNGDWGKLKSGAGWISLLHVTKM